ncbi:MAG: nucleotidyltransferase family protein [Rhodospirillales bacterium]|nr:nucleotidyltransferase family protein [Rhodospirillales bacterium]
MKDLAMILAELRGLQAELKARYPIRQIGVFGSYARGEQRPDSDLDLVVDLGPGVTLIDLARLESELSSRLGLPVEVAIKDALKPRIGKRILTEAIMV